MQFSLLLPYAALLRLLFNCSIAVPMPLHWVWSYLIAMQTEQAIARRVSLLLLCLFGVASAFFGWQHRQQRRRPRYHPMMSTSTSSTSTKNRILRKVDDWACVSNCGACCKLGINKRVWFSFPLLEVDHNIPSCSVCMETQVQSSLGPIWILICLQKSLKNTNRW